jgi:hypothetical protein
LSSDDDIDYSNVEKVYDPNITKPKLHVPMEAGCGSTIVMIVIIVLIANLCDDDKKKEPSKSKSAAAGQVEKGPLGGGVRIDTNDGRGVFLRSAPTDSARTKNGIWEGAQVKPTGNRSSDASGNEWIEIEVSGQPGKRGWVKREWLDGY